MRNLTIVLLVLACVTGCAQPSTNAEPPAQLTDIIVALDVPIKKGSVFPTPEAIDPVRMSFLERLKALLSEKERKTIRSVDQLAIVSFQVETALVGEVLTWPEVKNISLNKELQKFGN